MKKKIRIPKNSFTIEYGGENLGAIVGQLIDVFGFNLDDLMYARLEIDYSDCYYESDIPRVKIEWGNIR